MSPNKTVFTFFIACVFTEVATWTIDLPEARKHYFEEAEEIKKSDENKKDLNQNGLFFDNIVPDSPYNRDELEHSHEKTLSHENGDEKDVSGESYADDYEYMSYMEKKVHNIVQNGSVYLEGLRQALERYGDVLMNCSRLNFTQGRPADGPWLPENERPSPSPGPGLGAGGGTGAPNFPQVPDFDPNNPAPMPNFGPGNFTQIQNVTLPKANEPLNAVTCERATRYSEHVRKIAALALWATRELQDRAYANKYEKPSPEAEDEETELLLRLAFFLDRLAALTGYEPQPQHLTTTTTTTTTPQPPTTAVMSAMGDVSDEAKSLMMDCLRSSSDPDKCRFPNTSPEYLRLLFGTDSTQNGPARFTPRGSTLREVFQSAAPPPTPPPLSARPRPRPRPRPRRDLRGAVTDDRDKRGILTIAHKIAEIHEERSFHEPYHEPVFPRRKILMEGLAVLKNGGRKLIEKIVELRHEREHGFERQLVPRSEARRRRRRSARALPPSPALHLMQYYVKHQVWTNSNPTRQTEDSRGDYDVENHLTSVKSEHSPSDRIQKRSLGKKYEHLRLPTVKPRPWTNHIHDANPHQKLHAYLEKISHSSPAAAKQYVRKLLKHVQKRSIEYGNKQLPSRAQDPRQDISYYVKNKEGTERRPDLAQAAQVRAGLELVFQNPNIEVVRRYGANYNPAIPYPLGYGVASSFFTDL